MANSTSTITVNAFPTGKSQLQSSEEFYGTIAFAAGDYVANGIPTTWVPMTGTGSTRVYPLSTATKPFFCTIYGIAGFIYAYDAAHNSVRIFESAGSAAALAELSVAALPAGVTGDTITFRAIFSKD